MTFKVAAKNRPLVDPDKLAAFASGADTPAASNLDDKRRSYVFNLRFTEREMAALTAKIANTPDSKHSYLIRLFRDNVGMV
jgi:hypothetical protein